MVDSRFRFGLAVVMTVLFGMPNMASAQSDETTDNKKVSTAAAEKESSNAVNETEDAAAETQLSEPNAEGIEEPSDNAAAAASVDTAKKEEPVTPPPSASAEESAEEKQVQTDSDSKTTQSTDITNKESDTTNDTSKENDVEEVDIVVAQNQKQHFTAKSVPRTDRIVNILTTQTVRPGALVLTVDHRAHDSFLSGEDAWFDYLGLDAGNLKIGIGLRLGLKDYLDFGFYRLSNGTDLFDVYEFDTKVRFLNQDDQFVNASLRIGATWFVQKDREDASGFFSQLNVDRRLFGCLLVGTGFAFHTDSTNDRKTYENENVSAAVLGYAEWRPIRRFSLNAEISANVAGYGSKFPIFAFSTRFLTHRHSFALVVANSQYMSADGIVTNSWRAFDELVFGFQIVREFNLLD